jgi:hypothetical protein
MKQTDNSRRTVRAVKSVSGNPEQLDMIELFGVFNMREEINNLPCAKRGKRSTPVRHRLPRYSKQAAQLSS